MKFLLFCPHAVRTGGPEALHQLSDELIKIGFEVEIFLYRMEDEQFIASLKNSGNLVNGTYFKLQGRSQDFEDYSCYKHRYASDIVMTADTVIVFPEAIAHWVVYFDAFRTLLWWLSVDNSFPALAQINLNHIRLPRITHAHQSQYARRFVENVIGRPSLHLGDYTPVTPHDENLNNKDSFAINGSHKIIFDIKSVVDTIEQETGLRGVIIRGMSRSEVYEIFSRSKFYIDLGNFPGKDRMPREALLRHCLPCTLGAGAGSEYGIIELARVPIGQIKYIKFMANNINMNYELLLAQHEATIQSIRLEKAAFARDVQAVAHALTRNG